MNANRQNLLLKWLAKQREVSEAEVIRQALERETECSSLAALTDTAAWDQINKFVQKRQAKYASSDQPVHWDRQELYTEQKNL